MSESGLRSVRLREGEGLTGEAERGRGSDR